ncbi:hypothetical protein [Longitalea luteola]|uniref:hypothetical protein n=1 Tax=Longitalea luteola TaxID=2812563 RepID=UPI001A965B04|nr:hypothetical protein [Longitalea luteola]
MKFVGIISDHERGLFKIGQPLSEYQIQKEVPVENLEQIINYLENGTVVVSFLHYVYDKMNNPIVPLIFYTDGTWIWPSYLGYYYSKQYTDLIPEEFLTDMKNNNYNPPTVDNEKLLEAQKLYVNTYDPNRKGGK